MITAIIETRNDEVALAHALAALVPAATEGVIRDVIVIDHGSDDGTLVVADAAGCTIVDAGAEDDAQRAAVEQARGDWLLFTAVADAAARLAGRCAGLHRPRDGRRTGSAASRRCSGQGACPPVPLAGCWPS